MKPTLTIALLCIFALSACGKKEPAWPTPAEAPITPVIETSTPEAAAPPPPGVPAPAPQDAPAALAGPAEGQSMLEFVTHAVQSFVVRYERPPKDLQEVVKAGFLRAVPEAPAGKKFVYDPTKLTVTLENH